MSRNGVEMTTAQGRRDAVAITKVPNLEVKAIMTHFAVEDAADVRTGLKAFNEQANWLIERGPAGPQQNHPARGQLVRHPGSARVAPGHGAPRRRCCSATPCRRTPNTSA
jgi:alanine racemase